MCSSTQERLELKLVSYGRKIDKFGRPAPEIEDLVAATGLSPLIRCCVVTGDPGLISALLDLVASIISVTIKIQIKTKHSSTSFRKCTILHTH